MRRISLDTDRKLGRYALDPVAQKHLDRLSSWRIHASRLFLGLVVMTFVAGLTVSLGFIEIPKRSMQIYACFLFLLLAAIFLSLIFMPAPRCGTCKQRMKKKSIDEFHATSYFFTCDACRVYADTGVSSE